MSAPDGWACPMGRPWSQHQGDQPLYKHYPIRFAAGGSLVCCIPCGTVRQVPAPPNLPVGPTLFTADEADEVMQQDHPAVRRDDPDTSQDAWDSVESNAGTLRLTVLLHLRVRGPSTTGEIAHARGWPRDSISPRMAELRHKGLVEDTGSRRAMPGKKSRQIVWRAVADT